MHLVPPLPRGVLWDLLWASIYPSVKWGPSQGYLQGSYGNGMK